MTVTKFENKTRSLHIQNKLNANLTALHALYYHIQLLTTCRTVYYDYVGHYFLGQIPNRELLLLLVSLISY